MAPPLVVAAFGAWLLAGTADALPQYRDEIPNGHIVPDCDGNIVAGVGHLNTAGGGARNPFGLDFQNAGNTWSSTLCGTDSDGDGRTNGEELGDPNCVWSKSSGPTTSVDPMTITHPGIVCASPSPPNPPGVLTTPAPPPPPPDTSASTRTSLFVIHGVCMLVACAFLFPLGALIPLVFRGSLEKWFALHFYTQITGTVVLVVGLILTMSAVEAHFSSSVGSHKVIGLFTVICFLGQVALGLLRPHKAAGEGKRVATPARKMWLHAHRAVALVALVLMLIQCITGPIALRDTFNEDWTAMLYTILGVLLFVVFAVACAGLGRSLKPVSGYASVVGRSPCTVFWIGLVTQLLLASAGVGLLLAGGTEIDGGTDKFTTFGSPISAQERALSYNWIASSDSQYSSGRERRRLQSYSWYDRLSVNIYYEAKDGSSDLLTGETLQKLVAAELALLRSFEGRYGSSYGVASSGGDLTTTAPSYLQEMPSSPAALFMEKTTNKWYYSGVLRTDVATRVAELTNHVAETQLLGEYDQHRRFCAESGTSSSSVQHEACLYSIQPFVVETFSKCSPTSRVLKAEMGFDVSLLRSRFNYDHVAMRTDLIAWLHEVTKSAADGALGGTISMHWSAYLADEDFTMADQDAYVVSDATISLIALAMVFLLILVNTREGFVSFMGWLSIFLCFPISFVPYYVFLGVRWMGILNLMTLFIIFGIGADDIFVLRTMWEHSMQVCPPDDYVARLKYALPHAGETMLATSLTTAVAFLANAVSLIPPLKLYGLLAGFEVIVLFFAVMLWFPSVLVLQAKVFAKCCAKGSPGESVSPSPTLFSKLTAPVVNLSRKLQRQWPVWLWRASPVLLPAAVAFIAVSLAACAYIQPASEQPSLWKEGHNHFEASHISQKVLGKRSLTPEVAPVDIVWGLTPRDERSMDPSDASDPCSGSSDCPSFWDPTFSFSSPLAQLHMLDVCDRLLSEPAHARNFPAIQCPMYGFRDYLRAVNRTFPVPAADFSTQLFEWLDACRMGTAPTTSACSLGSAMVSPTEMMREYNSVDGTRKIAWIKIVVYTTMTRTMDPLTLRKHWTWWEDFITSANARAPPGVKKAFQYFPGYPLMETLLNLLQSGFTATVLSCSLAFTVLMIASGDIVVGLLAFCCVISVVIIVIGLIVLTGSTLGIIESICLSILVGLSVDYVVHVGVAYVVVPGTHSRRDRAAAAVRSIGGAVVAGALTTLACTAFLFPTTLSFFGIFGRFILAVCISGVLISLGVFPMLLMHFGTETDACKPQKWALFRSPKARLTNTGETSSSFAGSAVVEMQSSAPPSPPTSPPPVHGSGADDVNLQMPEPGIMGTVKARAALGTVLLAMLAAGMGVAATKGSGNKAGSCSADGTVTLRFSDYLVANATDSYVCKQMPLPTDCAYHVTRMSPLETTSYPHHMILFSVINDLGKCEVSCFDMPGQVSIIWAWAVGGGAFELPPDVGLRIGADSSHMLSTLQMHYNNPQGDMGQLDSSGVEFELTSTLRPKEMVMMMSGAPPSNIIAIPPGQRAYVLQVEVPLRIVAPITAFKYAMHAHQTGTRLTAYLVRDGQVVSGLGSEDPYQFDFQTFRDFPADVIIQPGDRLRLRCEFDTRARSECTYGGDRSSQEMCLQFMAAYPAEAVTDFGSLESTFDEYISDPVTAWTALRGSDPNNWPQWVVDSQSGATCVQSSLGAEGYACAHTFMPGFTLHFNTSDDSSGNTDLLGKLVLDTTASPTPSWLSVGVSPTVSGSMIGGWAIIGQPAYGGTTASVGMYDLNGKATSLVVPSADSSRLLTSSIAVVGGVTELTFTARMGTATGDLQTTGFTTLLAAHGTSTPTLGYHGSRKTHASVALVATPDPAASAGGLVPSGDPDYNPCLAN